MRRAIKDVLAFRSDISQFLVHLTKNSDGLAAKDRLKDMLNTGILRQSGNPVADSRWRLPFTHTLFTELTSAICFTETPLSQIHCLLNIAKRQVNLEPYGLVFMKDRLQGMHISPVHYINNWADDAVDMFDAYRFLADSATHGDAAQRILPLLSLYGHYLEALNGKKQTGKQDFYWEREWRRPYCHGDFEFDYRKDIFVGMCPQGEVREFEGAFDMSFFDPRVAMSYASKKLVARRKVLGLKISVV